MNLNPPSIAGGEPVPEDARPVACHDTAGQVEIGEVEDVEDYRLSNFVTPPRSSYEKLEKQPLQ